MTDEERNVGPPGDPFECARRPFDGEFREVLAEPVQAADLDRPDVARPDDVGDDGRRVGRFVPNPHQRRVDDADDDGEVPLVAVERGRVPRAEDDGGSVDGRRSIAGGLCSQW